MKRIKKQKRYHFTQGKEKQTVENNSQVSRFISEGSPDAQQDQSRDEKLVDNIQRAIEKEEFLSTVLDNIQVMANSGIITLEGSVSTEQQKTVAGERAAAFAGFNNINNNLRVA
jgi:osmotically-inducible protein OsmY